MDNNHHASFAYFLYQKTKQKSDFFDGFVEESEKEYVNHHEASNTEMLVRLGRQLISSSSHCLCSYKKKHTHTNTHTQTTNRKSIEHKPHGHNSH